MLLEITADLLIVCVFQVEHPDTGSAEVNLLIDSLLLLLYVKVLTETLGCVFCEMLEERQETVKYFQLTKPFLLFQDHSLFNIPSIIKLDRYAPYSGASNRD